MFDEIVGNYLTQSADRIRSLARHSVVGSKNRKPQPSGHCSVLSLSHKTFVVNLGSLDTDGSYRNWQRLPSIGSKKDC